jgi:hypothetical protein
MYYLASRNKNDITDDMQNRWYVPKEMRNEGLDTVCAGSVVPVAMSAASCCNCTFQDTQFLAGSCGASFTLFMGLVEYLVRSQDDIADPCNRPGRDRVKVSAISSLFIRLFKDGMSI